MTLKTILIVLLFTLWVLPCHALEVTFKAGAEVNGDTILLGDIVDISENSELAEALVSQIIGPSPEPGLVFSLDSRNIIGNIEKQNGRLNDIQWKGSSSVTIHRLSITIGPEKIKTIIRDYIAENRSRLPKAEIRFIPDSLPLPFALPTGKLSWDVVPSSPSIIGSSRFSLIFKVDNRVRKNFSVRGHTEAMAPVIVATKTLKFGELITPDKTRLASRDLATLNNYTDQSHLVIGSIAKRTIRTGSAIDTASIERPPIIRRGELVKIVVNHNGLLLTATGIAKTSGRKDEIIRVRNSSSNKLIYCRVQAPGLVEVTL